MPTSLKVSAPTFVDIANPDSSERPSQFVQPGVVVTVTGNKTDLANVMALMQGHRDVKVIQAKDGQLGICRKIDNVSMWRQTQAGVERIMETAREIRDCDLLDRIVVTGYGHTSKLQKEADQIGLAKSAANTALAWAPLLPAKWRAGFSDGGERRLNRLLKEVERASKNPHDRSDEAARRRLEIIAADETTTMSGLPGLAENSTNYVRTILAKADEFAAQQINQLMSACAIEPITGTVLRVDTAAGTRDGRPLTYVTYTSAGQDADRVISAIHASAIRHIKQPGLKDLPGTIDGILKEVGQPRPLTHEETQTQFVRGSRRPTFDPLDLTETARNTEMKVTDVKQDKGRVSVSVVGRFPSTADMVEHLAQFRFEVSHILGGADELLAKGSPARAGVTKQSASAPQPKGRI